MSNTSKVIAKFDWDLYEVPLEVPDSILSGEADEEEKQSLAESSQ